MKVMVIIIINNDHNDISNNDNDDINNNDEANDNSSINYW